MFLKDRKGKRFFQNRIALTFDVYWRNNFDLIGQAFTQGAGGTISKYANVADMKSSGVELGLSTINIQTDRFKWTSDLIYSKTKNEINGSKLRIEGGAMGDIEDVGAPDGTTMFVKNLFFNTPARKKFLKSEMTEGAYIAPNEPKVFTADEPFSFFIYTTCNDTTAILFAGEIIE